MVRVYLFRKINATHPNPYISNLEEQLSINFEIVNRTNNKVGVLELFKYLFKADIFYFNWIENIPQNRLGKLQSITFFLFILVGKCFKKRIVWTLHNKYPHDQNKSSWVDLMYHVLIKYADLIITHSQAGVEFIKANYLSDTSKVKYIIHPVIGILPAQIEHKKNYDFLIWGKIQPYKGVIDFLKFINGSENMRPLKILIAGKCFDEEYKVELIKNLSDHILYFDDFFEIAEISKFASQAKFVLFTYKTDSILSSASLMDSIRMRSFIIGPNEGAFKDLKDYKFLFIYDNYSEIIDIYKDYDNKNFPNREVEEFCENNTWGKLGDKLKIELFKLFQN